MSKEVKYLNSHPVTSLELITYRLGLCLGVRRLGTIPPNLGFLDLLVGVGHEDFYFLLLVFIPALLRQLALNLSLIGSVTASALTGVGRLTGFRRGALCRLGGLGRSGLAHALRLLQRARKLINRPAQLARAQRRCKLGNLTVVAVPLWDLAGSR